MDGGWACLARRAFPILESFFAKPPDFEGVRRLRCLQHADGRAGYRHTHPTERLRAGFT